MKLTFLGTGSAFTMKNWQTNMLMEFDDGYKLLIDCGGDIRFALAEYELSYLDINGVYVSHLHADHIGGLEWLAFTTYFDPRYADRPDLFISEFLVDDLWTRSLSGGLASLQGKRNTIERFFAVHAVEKNGAFRIGPPTNSPEFHLVQTVHFVNGFTFELSFGLLFEVGPEVVFITTDTQFAPHQIKDFGTVKRIMLTLGHFLKHRIVGWRVKRRGVGVIRMCNRQPA
jgi:ribonuclease BN (tRNA processing enzyme)